MKIMYSLHNSRELVLLYYISVSSFVCALNDGTFYQSSIENPITKVIRHDMHAAFNPVTSNTSKSDIDNVVAKMYNIRTSNNNMDISSAMIFKLPYNDATKDTRQAERIVLMERKQFMEPTFPNITLSYMTLRRYKFLKSPLAHNITELMKDEMDMLNQQSMSINDSWSHLGLNGWNGDIAEPSQSNDHNHNFPTNSLNEYPHLEITKQLNGGFAPTEYLKEIAATEIRQKNERLEMMKEMDKDVFIARVNDPFGYSTKWQMRKTIQTKHKRDVLRLYSMIKCSTGCEPLNYKGYGCYCGFLGHGIPTDGIDKCCKLHDKCYEHSNCISYLEYFVPYVWKCYRGKPLCAIDHGEWGGPESCAARLCYCDLRLSRCLRQFACPAKRAVCRSSVSRRLQNLLLV